MSIYHVDHKVAERVPDSWGFKPTSAVMCPEGGLNDDAFAKKFLADTCKGGYRMFPDKVYFELREDAALFNLSRE